MHLRMPSNTLTNYHCSLPLIKTKLSPFTSSSGAGEINTKIMDESWRMRIGMPTPPQPPQPPKLPDYPPRRSTDDRRKQISGDSLSPDDFTDVFGGPPRTVLSRQFSAGLPRSSSNFFYEEVFRPPEKSAPVVVKGNGRSLPEFMIPGRSRRSDQNQSRNQGRFDQIDGFYSDIFGWDDERVVRSRSRSKASSSSVLSSEELSPLRYGNDDVSMFASKLRPINVGTKWNSTRMGHNNYQRQKSMPSSAGSHPKYNTENECFESLKNYPFGINRRNASPETISLEPISNCSYRASADDFELNSPSSVVSSVCQSDREQKSREMDDEILMQDETELEDDDETMSAYVIEINSDNKEGTCESNGIDEAIAWAKEKFQTYCSESKGSSQECDKEKTTEEMLSGHQHSQGHTESSGSPDEQQDKWGAEEDVQQFESKVQTEMQSLDEKIRLWSTGKEANIRLLLTSLHHILWPNSGWLAVSLTNIIESSQLKKAYQRARLCLHPDKLQQRGATLPQKYIAEKAFSVLQDAWAAFVSQDVFYQ